MMTTIELNKEEVVERLGELYTAIWDHQDFWKGWISDRIGFMADFFATPEEQEAAAALSIALLDIAALADTDVEDV